MIMGGYQGSTAVPGGQSLYDVLLDEGFSEEQIDRLMGLGVLNTEQDILGRQLDTAEALRGAPMPRGRGFGRIYAASNPLEFLATGMDRWQGARQMLDIPEQMRRVAQEQGDIRSSILRGQGMVSPAQPRMGQPTMQGPGQVSPTTRTFPFPIRPDVLRTPI